MTIKDNGINKDLIKTQNLINLFYHPVLVVNNNLDILAANNKLTANEVLSSNLPIILDTILPLLNGEQELAFCVMEGEEKLFTAMPMEHGRTLVKIANSKPSALAKRYYNLVTAIDKIPDAAIICSDGKIDLVNEQFQRIFPFGANRSLNDVPLDSILKDFSLYFSQDDVRLRTITYRFLRRKFNSKQELSLSFTSPDGQYYEYRDNLTFTGGRVGLIINESQIKGLNEQLESAFNEANVLSNAKSNFMAAMSHEVRTPLNGIIGLLDLCEHQEALKGNELLRRVSKSSTALLNLINDVLDFTKFDANMVQLSPTDINLRILCEDLISTFYGQAKQQHIELTLYVDPIIPSVVNVDELRLTQVLTNLVSNGLKFNQKLNATLRIEVLKDELTDYINFNVIDNGIGIESTKVHTIFDRFTQANDDIHKNFGGTGLGLSICQKVVQLMGGGIYVESELGTGSTFVVQLPLKACSESEVERLSPSLKGYTFETNNPVFFNDLELYAKRLGFNARFIDDMPKSAAPKHLYLLDEIRALESGLVESEMSFHAALSNLPEDQTALIVDNINKAVPSDTKQIHLVPLKLLELHALTLPSTAATSSSGQPVQPRNISSRLRILVVEDNEDNIYVLKKQFDALGVKASFAMSAEEAVIFFEQQPFNLVISDYQMPVITGGELIGILRDLEETEQRSPATMFILTADNSKQCQAHCREVGVDRILMKPLTLQTLSDLITRTNNELEPIVQQDFSQEPLAATEAIPQEDTYTFEGDFFDDSSQVNTNIDPAGIFDISALIEMVGEISPKEEYEYLCSFESNLKRDYSQMRDLVDASDWESLSKLAHRLKSSARIVGAYHLSHLCEIVETTGRHTAPDELMLKYWEEMKTAIEDLITHLSQYLENHDARQ
ncbi:ATP-binding protein [Alteromonas sp. 1_MG-2023]|uniref:ATP-binding protein n=1 Tax=Alteromonas sp. 1_MG-2023 TaxID=3062669 RepID=UPI0026E3A177|nr:ATP-binding protein [Alteromonas sp. 1_MG-2023]MDO6566668.1 ATP-binding protein [Alteromonas sp. 1_MG-2023]